MHCSNCGIELPENARFCPECGAEFGIIIEKPAAVEKSAAQQPLPPRRAPPAEARQAPIPSRRVQLASEQDATAPATTVARKSRRARKASASRIIISLILIFAVVGSALAVITLVTWGSYTGNASHNYAPSTLPASESWSFSTDSTDMNIQYTTNTTAPEVQVYVNYDFAGAFMKGKTASDLYTLTFDNASKVFSLARKDVWTFALFDHSTVNVTLNPMVIFSVTASVTSGNLVMTIPDSIKVGTLSLSTVSGNNHLNIGDNDTIEGTVQMATTSGNVDITSGNSTYKQALSFQSTSGNVGVTLNRGNASGNIAANSTSGNVNVNIVNMTLGSNIRLDIGVTSGNINLVMDQRLKPAKTVSCSLKDTSGNIVVDYKAKSAQTSTTFTNTKVSGNIVCTNNGGFQEIAGGAVFQSLNQSKSVRFDASAHAVSGNIRITGQMYA
jgi:hypothetical protein